jgi:ABC-type multidrug transport system ATPase subunit
VQQDDVLFETMTPYELLEFAFRIRSGKDGLEVKDRVESIIKKLSLQACRDTMIGGWL